MNKYNPNIHNRRSIRLKGYDYSQAGMYFITICCQDRECRFGKIENDEMNWEINQKIKQWGNCGNEITTNILSVTNNHINVFRITL